MKITTSLMPAVNSASLTQINTSKSISTKKKATASTSETKVVTRETPENKPAIITSQTKLDSSKMSNATLEIKPSETKLSSTPKRVHKPGPKLPNCDYCLPKDVLAILTAKKDFYKNNNSNPSILRNAGMQGKGNFFQYCAIGPYFHFTYA